MMFARALFFLLILAFVELWLFPLPLSFIALFLFQQLYSEEQTLILAFLIGFVFDIFLIRTLGTTPLFFITMLFITMLYKRKYEAYNLVFVGASMFLGTLALEFFLHKQVAIGGSVTSAIVSALFARIFSTKRTRYEPWYRVS